MDIRSAIVQFMVRFVTSGFPPMHDHDSARSKEAVKSQPASALYLDCGHDMGAMEHALRVCVDLGWIVEPFGLALGLGVNQETFECTALGLEKGEKMLEALNEVDK
jgi:hypothetical protein